MSRLRFVLPGICLLLSMQTVQADDIDAHRFTGDDELQTVADGDPERRRQTGFDRRNAALKELRGVADRAVVLERGAVAWQGPIVMNTREELRIAFEEFHNGTFVKHH